MIRFCDDAGNVIEAHEHKAISKSGEAYYFGLPGLFHPPDNDESHAFVLRAILPE